MLIEQYGLGSLCTGNQGRKKYIPFNKRDEAHQSPLTWISMTHAGSHGCSPRTLGRDVS